ncbi:MAG: hypothetical protein HZA14_05665 [Nitrospirae bacterium]|nr:hypothetical protein [Nitrospirota bacterium]
MKANNEFLNLPKSFWAAIRTIGQACGYTERSTGQIKIPKIEEIEAAFESLSLDKTKLRNTNGALSEYSSQIISYCDYRADVLNTFVEPHLMDVKRAKAEFVRLKSKLKPKCPLPMNKQKGKKRSPNYFTGIINMLIETGIGDLPCEYDPRVLTTVTKDGLPVRTLARRIDGAFPGAVNPIAVWEIKEYYYTTTFGSRVADGVYETLLDGMEFEELRRSENHNVLHYLMVDAHYTWWDCGRSYLCRIIDMLNMGYVDEVFFGYEVVEALPAAVADWTKKL